MGRGVASTERSRRHPTQAEEKRAEEGEGDGEGWMEGERRERCERQGEGRGGDGERGECTEWPRETE